MTAPARRRRQALGVTVIGLVISISIHAKAVAQEAADQNESAATEDTSWQDKSARQLRREYRDAEAAFYEAFNAVNSDDEFDMECKTAPVLGSRKRERRCQADFIWEYEKQLGEEMARRSTTGSPGSATTSIATLERKQNELRAEMTAAVANYPDVEAAFAALNRAKQNYERKMAED